jgi:hypothetical protein
MKKTLLIALLILSGCANKYESETEVRYNDVPLKEIVDGVNYQIVIIDSCEYIFGTDCSAYNGGYFLSHKGNCKNHK